MMIRIAILAALALAPSLASAQSSPLVGEWAVSMSVGTRVENDVQTDLVQTGSLTVVTEGDSLIATLKMQPPEGMPPRPPSRIAAKIAPGTVVFVLHSQAMLVTNGESTTRAATSTFTLSATGDALTGTVVRSIEGMDVPATPRPITGTRVKK